MTAQHLDALNFEEQIRQLIAQGDIESAMAFIRLIVDGVRHDPAATGLVLASPTLDALCAEIGALSLAQLRNSNAYPLERDDIDIIILATELYDIGGHSRVIEDFIATRPDKRHLLLLTNYLDSSNDFSPKRFKTAQLRVERIKADSRWAKLLATQTALAKHPQAQVLVFNHHADVAAIAAIQPGLNREILFIHHGDHNLSLGVHLPHARHVDFFEPYHHQCQARGIKPEYWPLSLPDRGARNLAASSFMSQGAVLSASCGSWTKYRAACNTPYWEMLPLILKSTGGQHLHIGDLPDGMLAAMRESLALQGIAPQRLQHMARVNSLWEALISQGVDVFIGSFPLGGGRACIEAMGAGIPMICYRHPLDPMLGMTGLGPTDTLNWTKPPELQQILSHLQPEDLARRARTARAHYLSQHNPQAFAEKLNSAAPSARDKNLKPARDELRAYLMRSAVRDESLGSIMQRLAEASAGQARPTLTNARALLTAGNDEAAFQILIALLEQGQQPDLILVHLGQISLRAGLFDDARNFFDHAIAASSDLESTRREVVQHCLDNAAPAIAAAYLGSADDPPSQDLQARVLQAQGKHDAALSQLENWLSSHPNDSSLREHAIALAHETAQAERELALLSASPAQPQHWLRAIALEHALGSNSDASEALLARCASELATLSTRHTAPAHPKKKTGGKFRLGILLNSTHEIPALHWLTPLLQALPADKLSCHLISPRTTQPQLQGLALLCDAWHTLPQQDFAADARALRSLNLDCLIAIDALADWHCLQVLALRAAPLQMLWSDQALPNTLANIDQVIGPNMLPAYAFAPTSTQRMGSAQGLTLGCLTPIAQLAGADWQSMRALLEASPQVRLLLNNPGGSAIAQTYWRDFIKAQNLVAKQVHFIQAHTPQAYCAALRGIDLCLLTRDRQDPYTTQLCAWMGVPSESVRIPATWLADAIQRGPLCDAVRAQASHAARQAKALSLQNFAGKFCAQLGLAL